MDDLKGYDSNDMTSIKDMDNVSLANSLNGNVKGKKLFYIKEICLKENYQNKQTLQMLDKFNETLNIVKDLGIEVYEESVDIELLNAIKPIYDCISCAEATSNDSNLTGIIFGPRGEGDNITEIIKNVYST